MVPHAPQLLWSLVKYVQAALAPVPQRASIPGHTHLPA
jgi:hypothetical protein